MCQSVLMRVKRVRVTWCPVKGSIFDQKISERSSNLREAAYESTVETSETEERTDFTRIARLWPSINCVNFGSFHADAVLVDDVAKEGDFRTPQFTLGLFGVEVVGAEACEYFPKEALVFFCSFGVNENVVKENDNALV